MMKDSARYAKVVAWSEEDQYFIGSASGLIFGGCHGDDEKKVFQELCQLVEDVIRVYLESGKPLPSPVCGANLIDKLQSVA